MEILYSVEHWSIFEEKRRRTRDILMKLSSLGMEGYVYGSVARGDVRKDSDIDIIVFSPVFVKLEMIDSSHKFIIQATPASTPKAYISLDPLESEVISFPLSKMRKNEEEFYGFGGLINMEGVEKKIRVPGVNKMLNLVLPNDKGHFEIPVDENEEMVAKLLHISLETVKERKSLLTRRKEKGKTGVFLKYKLGVDETFEDAIRKLSKNNKFFRRVINEQF
ncbi:nucleotidyltransferase domain-containing protein [Candidatus Acidianus copahuensis]|uniref:protein adenylyltransferase n=1 Tax=Candidatus Acidianus copahuensis TaxID=1160895 RepID=A0A031LNM0_9CREN|nr:nucleotidyltransferase domain-containing protein [Candidatus Acidianus copahuensis]EZQ03149.1 DNA polymerase subunit beta [Candidatus Acidianus copahuensis]NON62214.1 DNA polymerase subunit beta [Acidianus sp. RZ1]